MPIPIQASPSLPVEFAGLADCGCAHSDVNFRVLVEEQLARGPFEGTRTVDAFASNQLSPGVDSLGGWLAGANSYLFSDELAIPAELVFASPPQLIDSLLAEIRVEGNTFVSGEAAMLESIEDADEESVDLEYQSDLESAAAHGLLVLPTVGPIIAADERIPNRGLTGDEEPNDEMKSGEPTVLLVAPRPGLNSAVVDKPLPSVVNQSNSEPSPLEAEATFFSSSQDAFTGARANSRPGAEASASSIDGQPTHVAAKNSQSEKLAQPAISVASEHPGVPEVPVGNEEAFSLVISPVLNVWRTPGSGASGLNHEISTAFATVKPQETSVDFLESCNSSTADTASDGQNSDASKRQPSVSQPETKSDPKQQRSLEDEPEFRRQSGSTPDPRLSGRLGSLSAEPRSDTQTAPATGPQSPVQSSLQTNAAPPSDSSPTVSPESSSIAARVWDSAFVASPSVRSLSPMKEIDLRLPVDNHTVDVQLRERAGLLDVSVRTSDATLAKEMQAGLGDLVRSLESQGYDAAPRAVEESLTQRIHEPLSELGSATHSRDPSHDGDPSHGGSAGGDSSGGQGQRGRRNRRQNSPNESSFSETFSAGGLPVSEVSFERR